MSYKPYATVNDYMNLLEDAVDVEDADMRQASRHIDTLTYNRIVARGFENLTPFQQEIIKEVVCRQAEFEVENADAISSVLSSYSINGVSMAFGSSWNVFTDYGIAMRRDVYALLQQTGLCCRLLR